MIEKPLFDILHKSLITKQKPGNILNSNTTAIVFFKITKLSKTLKNKS